MAEERPADRLARFRLKTAKVTLWVVGGGCLAVVVAAVLVILFVVFVLPLLL